MTSSTNTAPIERAIASLPAGDLSSFLRRQRWFAAKATESLAPRVVSSIVMPWGDGAFAIALIEVEDSTKTSTYQVPLAARNSPRSDVPASAVVGTVDVVGAPMSIYDAVFDSDFRDGLVQATMAGVTIQGAAASRCVIEPVADTGVVLAPNITTEVSGADQSNTSIVVGEQVILKLFRTLEPGPHPDVEVTRFLTSRAHFANTPPLLAEMRIEDNGTTITSGMAQAYLPGATDAWSVALDRGRPYFTAPADREATNGFIDDAKRLGVITRAMHDALASDDEHPDFAPEPTAQEDLDRWAHRAQQSIRDSLALLEQQLGASTFPRDRAPEAQALVARRDHYLGWINEIDDDLGEDLGMRTRVHGDFHLGQVLRSRSGDFMIIDFEGEPSRPLSERREKTSPLRDVAGMLRSFAYAAATLARTDGKNAPPHIRELRIARWERDVRAAYLSGYLADTDDPGILPDEEANVRRLIALFETEKAFYELAYELNNRPAWAWIPMRGIAKLFTKV